MVNAKKKGGLGRGLDAIYEDVLQNDLKRTDGGGRIEEAEISSLVAGRYQPRMRMDEAALAELADSIRSEGVISPIIVRPIGGARYEIVAGERRFRAAALAGLDRVPVVVRELDDEHALAVGLIENMQREDLNPIEEARGIERLIEEFGFTHENAARVLGRSRSATTNILRLLSLTDEVKEMLESRELEMGHARALLALEGAEQVACAKEIAARGLSVREAEQLVKRSGAEPARPKERVVIKTRDDERLEETLAESLGTVVRLTANKKGKGRIVIEFSNLDQLEGIVNRIQR